MGQILNIEITKNGKSLANSYYHWSGYSSSAIEMVISIIKDFNYIEKYKVDNVKNKDLIDFHLPKTCNGDYVFFEEDCQEIVEEILNLIKGEKLED